MEIIFATKNRHKMQEIRAILREPEFHVISMAEAGIDVDIVEDSPTFEGNAIKKAIEIMRVTGKDVMSDDSGIEIDFLDKRPGVHSARFLGEDTPYEIKNNSLLEMLRDVPYERRTARFVCVIAYAPVGGEVITARGCVEGVIADSARGSNGFGYDPIFFVPEHRMTMAELSFEAKNEISHRARALECMKARILRNI